MPRVSAMLIAAAIAGSAHADCRVDGAESRPHLIELYTSEGCSSCPPADAWLSSVQSSAAVVPIAFHVDYWDSLGWKDRFAQPGFAERQVAIARRGLSGAYTPEVVLDGREWRAWRRGAPLEAAPRASGTLRVHAAASAVVDVDWTADDVAGARAYLALVEDGLASDVSRGENSGRVLHHDHVVRVFAGPLAAASGKARLAPPADLDVERTRLVAWLQDPVTGVVGDVVQRRLAECSAVR